MGQSPDNRAFADSNIRQDNERTDLNTTKQAHDRNSSENRNIMCEKVLGMVSHLSDFLLFERPVIYSAKAEVWLLKVEYCAQETVSKMIGYAVSSFPKQPLDEWIVDYPQQTILSTIHLILTHEINEMLHEMGPSGHSQGPSMTQEGPSDTLGLIHEASNLRSRSIHQLNDTSKLTSRADEGEHKDEITRQQEVTKFTEEQKQPETQEAVEGEGSQGHEEEQESEGETEGEGEDEDKQQSKSMQVI